MSTTPSSSADPGGDPSTAGARAAAPPTAPPHTGRGGQPRLFASVWRWHFYAGLLSIPVIVLLCLSGIVYLFKPQIDAVAYGSMRSVPVQDHRASYAAQSAAVVRAHPGAVITGLAPSPEPDRASEFDITTRGGDDLRVYVDPYTARVTGDRNPSRSFTTLALDLHGTLLTSRVFDEAGTFGDRVIELTASWAVVLVITGMYLWWPRGRRGVREALRPRLRSRSSRTRWRDLHAVTGVVFGFVTLFFLVTGLAWSGVWGSKFNEVTQDAGLLYPNGLYDGAESGTVGDTVQNGKAAWSASELPLANSGSPGSIPEQGGRPGHSGHSGHLATGGASAASQPSGAAAQPSASDVDAITAGRDDIEVRGLGDDGHTGHAHGGTLVWDASKGAPIDAVVGRITAMGFPAGSTIAFPADDRGSYTVSRFPDSDVAPNATAGSERLAYIDQYTALPIHDFDFDQFGAVGKAADFGIALHEGRQWGIWSQLFSLIGTLALLLSCATAVVMWRKRKPKGIGSPRRPPNRKLGAGVVVITLALGVFFPLLGLSIVALLVFDFVVVRHVPPLRRALGAR